MNTPARQLMTDTKYYQIHERDDIKTNFDKMFTDEIDSSICSTFNRAAVGDHLETRRDAFELLCQVTTPDITYKHTQLLHNDKYYNFQS